MTSNIEHRDFLPELNFQNSRSSGPGGQNVNKVNTKVDLRFNVASSQLLSDYEKIVIFQKLGNRITQEGDLLLSCQTERTQLKNKEKVIDKFYQLLANALKRKKIRKTTKPTKASKLKRLDTKKRLSDRKKMRRKPLL